MPNPSSPAANRLQLLQRLFPHGVPVLWCPSLTHYEAGGAIDAARIAAHLRHLSPHVKGFLIPGSTGDGWDLNEPETRQILELGLDQAQKLNLHLLIGILKPTAQEALETIRQTLSLLQSRTGENAIENAFTKARVRGFAICPPRGRDLSQEEIGRALTSILEAGLPTALYQLPQVTQNEISGELASDLAGRFENFIFFKDSSGADRVVQSAKPLGGVFTMRGAEGDYARWLKTAGGPYDGFLLSTANCFAREFSQLMNDLAAARLDAAQPMSERLTKVISDVFGLVKDLPQGNAFTNANKAMDHFFAYGPRASGAPLPRLHAGRCLPLEVLRATGEILSRHALMPARGYLE
jgi:dihydrodipicolinate synthase/N-acetylneuraminate lyase